MKNYLLTTSLLINLVVLTVAFDFRASKDEMPSSFDDDQGSKYFEYYYRRKSLFEVLPNDSNEIVFLGNSITNGCEWAELFGNQKIKNRGISGDTAEGVLDRLDEVIESNPSKIFLMIGTNDLKKKSVEGILSDYKEILTKISKESPNTQVFIQSVLPVYNSEGRDNASIISINQKLKEYADSFGHEYLDLHTAFVTNEGHLNMEYSFDGLHLNGKGYLLWKDLVIDYI